MGLGFPCHQSTSVITSPPEDLNDLVNLSLLLIGCDDYDKELNKNVFIFVHHFIDSTGRL